MRDCYMLCNECGELFLFPKAERLYYQQKGFAEPKYCRVCRAAYRQRRAASARRQIRFTRDAVKKDASFAE